MGSWSPCVLNTCSRVDSHPWTKTRNMLFKNRDQAARLLVAKLAKYGGQRPLVLGVPRGAVPMARTIAEGLGGDLDVVLVHKLRAPGQPELAIGSVDESAAAALGAAAREYLSMAIDLLEPPPPRLIAIGGLSGSGKSMLAARLAPAIGAVPGALILRTDVIRKALFGVPFNDFTNAFKLYRREVIEGLQPLISPHFNLTVEMPLKAITRGYSFAVVPINWANRQTGMSKLKIKEMGSRYLFIVLYVWLEKHLARGDYHRRHLAELPEVGLESRHV